MTLPAFTANSWTLDGLSFNTGDNGNGLSYLVKSSEGWLGSPPARPDLVPRQDGDGALRGPNYRGPRVVNLVGIAQAPNRAGREDLEDSLAGLCADPFTLYALTHQSYERELQLFVELNSDVRVLPLPDGITVSFDMQLVANDARKFATLVKTNQTAIAQAALEGVQWDGTAIPVTGTQWNGPASPVTGLVWQASSGVSGIMALDNEGTASTPIQFTVTAPTSGTLITPTITDITNGNVITYSGTLVPNDELFIDTATGLVLLNGAVASGQLSRAELFEIPRRSTIQVQFAAGGPADTAQLAAAWSDAY
jgi:hypothetical protein